MHNIMSGMERVTSILSMKNTMDCTPKEGNLNSYMTPTALPVMGHAVTRGASLVICSGTAES